MMMMTISMEEEHERRGGNVTKNVTNIVITKHPSKPTPSRNEENHIKSDRDQINESRKKSSNTETKLGKS